MKIVLALSLVPLLVLAGLAILRLMDRRADAAEWARLSAFQPDTPAVFTPEMVAELPDPAQRYFRYTIGAGTPLLSVAEIEMVGQFGLGNKGAPGYRPMWARQILAAPQGFVWAMSTRSGLPISGSDSGSWTRFRIFGLIPVARAGGNADHMRSAFGRYVAEAVFWTPAALLPRPGVSWEQVDTHIARVTVRHGDLTQAVDLTVDTDGRPISVLFQRWTNANPQKQYRLQPFGGTLSDFREVEGYRLPFRVDAGNMFGTDAYFPFFRAEITSIRFPRPPY